VRALVAGRDRAGRLPRRVRASGRAGRPWHPADGALAGAFVAGGVQRLGLCSPARPADSRLATWAAATLVASADAGHARLDGGPLVQPGQPAAMARHLCRLAGATAARDRTRESPNPNHPVPVAAGS